MSSVQADRNQLPPSPLSSRGFDAYSDDAQLGITFHERLQDNKISDTEIARLISQHNRQSIPIIPDEDFCERLYQRMTNSGKIDDLEVARSLLDESDRIAKDWDAARWNIKMADSDFFDTDDQATHFVSRHDGRRTNPQSANEAAQSESLGERARALRNKGKTRQHCDSRSHRGPETAKSTTPPPTPGNCDRAEAGKGGGFQKRKERNTPKVKRKSRIQSWASIFVAPCRSSRFRPHATKPTTKPIDRPTSPGAPSIYVGGLSVASPPSAIAPPPEQSDWQETGEKGT